MSLLIALGVILVVGYFSGLVAEKLSLPRVSAYLFAGILFSDEFLGHLIKLDLNSWADVFSEVCLGFIAYIIGGEINFKRLRTNSKLIVLGTFFASVFPLVIVFIAFYIASQFMNINPLMSVILAAISTTTAPAATVAVIEQFKAKGELTETTKGIVALDDAFGILLFFAVITLALGGNNEVHLSEAVSDVFFSILIGSLFGFIISKFAKLSPSNDYLFPLLLGVIFLTEGLASYIGYSTMLACMMIGIVANNSNIKENPRVSLLLPVQHIEELVFIIFFTFAGTHFSSHYFSEAIVFIIIYALARATGKYAGGYLGVSLGKPRNPVIAKWIGFTILPQAGVAIGLLIHVSHIEAVEPIKDLLFNIILGSTVIYEVLGPLLAKYAFKKAGEI